MAVSLAKVSKKDLPQFHSICRGDALELTLTEFMELLSRYSKQGPMFQFQIDEVPIAIAGILSVNSKVGHMWMVASDYVNLYPLSFIKQCKRVVKLAEGDYHRLQCDVRCDQLNYIKMVKLWGFQEEGILRQFNSDKSDSVMLSRIK